jgi:hypothetical protein
VSILSKEQILAAADLKYGEVDAPEWGGTLRIREFDAAARDVWRAAIDRDSGDMAITLACALAIVDSEGRQLFGRDDVEALARKSPKVLDRVFAAVIDINRVSADAVETAAKN